MTIKDMSDGSRASLVATPLIGETTVMAGQVTVASAGTAVSGPDVESDSGFWLKGHPDNTGSIWYGNDGQGDVDSNNGFPLSAGETIYARIGNLKLLRFDADESGEKVCWAIA